METIDTVAPCSGVDLKRYHLQPNFFDQAAAMRAAIDAHFGSPRAHSAATHQVWNYWWVDGLYAYLRTDPEKIMQYHIVEAFMSALRQWGLRNLGFSNITKPLLSLYVSGCGQGLHNDARNGRWAYVFSLTNWERRIFHGGETIIFRDNAYSWDAARPGAGESFYDRIEPEFNRLLVFDDRCIHGVERVQGTMDPREGRLVLHGHFDSPTNLREGLFVEGNLSAEQVFGAACEMQKAVLRRLYRERVDCQGPIALRLSVHTDGTVDNVEILSDCISKISKESQPPERARAIVLEELRSATLPRAEGPSNVTLTILVDK